MAAKGGLQASPVSMPWLIVAGVGAPFGFNIIPALLPAIQAEFALDPGSMQWMVSIYAFTMAIGQLIAGPLSDAFGRRIILLSGLAIFVCASVGAALADSYSQLLISRFLQGLGGCVTLMIPRAAVRDRYGGPDAARAMALIMISLSVTPAVAPLIGGILQTWLGWRAGFYACAVVGGVLLVLGHRLHGETLPPAKRVRVRLADTLRSYATLFAAWRFCAYAFGFSLLNCSFIGFLVVGPGFLTRSFGMTPVGISTAMLAAYGGFAAGNFLAARHIRRLGVDRLLAFGLAFGCTGTWLLIVMAGQSHWEWMLAAIGVQSFGTGLAFAAGIAGATAVYPERAGTASALVGAVQLLTGALFAVVSGALDDGSLRPLAWSALALCMGAAACIWPLWRRRDAVGVR